MKRLMNERKKKIYEKKSSMKVFYETNENFRDSRNQYSTYNFLNSTETNHIFCRWLTPTLSVCASHLKCQNLANKKIGKKIKKKETNSNLNLVSHFF